MAIYTKVRIDNQTEVEFNSREM